MKSYATVTGPVRYEELRENLMDEEDAEETAAGTSDEVVTTPAPEVPVVADAGSGVPPKDQLGQLKTPTPRAMSSQASSIKVKEVMTTTTPAPVADVMDMELGGGVAKWQREGNDTSQGTEVTSVEEPPTKAVPGRRSGCKSNHNVPPDRRTLPGLPS